MDFGSQLLEEGDGRRHFVGGSCMPGGILVQMFPSYHVHHWHEPPPQERSGSFTEGIPWEGARDPHVTPCLLLQESLLTIARVIPTLFFSSKGRGEQMQTASPTKWKHY